MNIVEITGGTTAGWLRVGWPGAKLRVTKDRLEIQAPLMDSISFAPEDILSIETYGFLPIFARGIKIKHRVAGYRTRIIFYIISDPKVLIERIRQVGFLK